MREEARFTGADWGLMAASRRCGLIDIGVDHLAPELVALLRAAAKQITATQPR